MSNTDPTTMTREELTVHLHTMLDALYQMALDEGYKIGQKAMHDWCIHTIEAQGNAHQSEDPDYDWGWSDALKQCAAAIRNAE